MLELPTKAVPLGFWPAEQAARPRYRQGTSPCRPTRARIVCACWEPTCARIMCLAERRRQEGSWVVQAGGGGNDGGSSGGSGGSGGGGGGDGGEGQPEDKKEPMFRWKGWEDRVAADPQFAYKVFIEQVGDARIRGGCAAGGGR